MRMLLATLKSDNHATELELRSLYSVVADAPISTNIVLFEEMTLDMDIYYEIIRGQYDAVYFHIDENNERSITKICEMVKKASPGITIITGGMQISFSSKAFLIENPCVDFVIRGEGETVLFNLLRTVITGEYRFENIAGLAYRDDFEIIVNPYDKFPSMDDIPFPYEKTELYEKSCVYYQTIRGTADKSIYVQHYPDTRVRPLSINRVCTELRYFLVKRVDKVVVLDKYFNFNVERAYRIFEYIISNDNGVTSFEFNIDGDKLDDEIIRLLGQARDGLLKFNVDIVSTNAETLAACGRLENVYQMMYNINRLIQSSKVKINFQLTAGLPLESEELFARSFNKVYGLAEGHTISINTLRVLRGSSLKQNSEEFGYIYCSETPYEVIATTLMPALDLINIKSIAGIVREFTGKEFKFSIPKFMMDASFKPYDFFKKLTEFIYDHKLLNRLDKVENKYRIIYAFAQNYYEEINDSLKLQVLLDFLHTDLENTLSSDAVRKFERKGWDLEIWQQ